MRCTDEKDQDHRMFLLKVGEGSFG